MHKYEEKIKVERLHYKTFAIAFVLLLSFTKTSVVAQSPIITNDSIQFKIAFTSFSLLDSVYAPMKWHVLAEACSDEIQFDYYAKLDTTTIFSLLNDPAFDWATNLILYNLYDMNALLINAFHIKSRADWLGYFKDKDLAMWRDFFSYKEPIDSPITPGKN